MEKNRIWVIVSVLAIAAVLGLGFLLGVQPQLAAIGVANEERAAVETTNQLAEAKLAALRKDFEEIDGLKADLATLVKSVPTSAHAPELVDQLDALAKQVGVALTAIAVSDAQPYTPVAEVPVETAPVAGAGDSDTAVADAGAAVTAPPVGAPPVVNALITPGNFAVLPVQVTIKGSYAQVLDYVNGLQTGERLFLVTGLSTTAASENEGVVEATIGGFVYAVLTPDLFVAPAG